MSPRRSLLPLPLWWRFMLDVCSGAAPGPRYVAYSDVFRGCVRGREEEERSLGVSRVGYQCLRVGCLALLL